MRLGTNATQLVAPKPAPEPTSGERTSTSVLGTDGVSALLGEDVVAARVALDRLSPADRSFVFSQPLGATGMVPMLAAASRGATQLMALFAGKGAALDVKTTAGFDSAFVALFNGKEDAARTILTKPKLVAGMDEALPVSAAFIEAELAALPAQPTDEHLNALANKLTDCGTKALTNTQSLGLYLAHMNDATDSPFIMKAEAWNPQGAVEARVRTLLAMAVTMPDGTDRDRIVREVAFGVEAARLDRRIFSVSQTKAPDVAQLALAREVDRILTKLKGAVASGNRPITTMVIPVATPQHTMFMSLAPWYIDYQPHVLLHFDNRGAGHDTHTRPDTKGMVYPIRTAVPATADMYEALRVLLMDVLGQRGSGTVDGVYDGIKEWLTTITLELSVDGIEDPKWRELAEYQQVAGNCSLANQEPGLERRLGTDLAASFHAFEQRDVRRRLLESVTPERIDAWISQTSERRDSEHSKMSG